MAEIRKFYPKKVRVAIKELGGDLNFFDMIKRETDHLFSLPIEERQAYYDGMKLRHGEDVIAISGPGIKD